MQIDPKVAMIVKMVLALLTALASGGPWLAGLVSAQTATLIVAIAGASITFIGTVMSAYSSSAPGPLAPQDPPSVQAAAKATGTKTN
jgi:hypothetical protein